MQSSIGKEIQFFRGLPEFKEDLREIDPKFTNNNNNNNNNNNTLFHPIIYKK